MPPKNVCGEGLCTSAGLRTIKLRGKVAWLHGWIWHFFLPVYHLYTQFSRARLLSVALIIKSVQNYDLFYLSGRWREQVLFRRRNNSWYKKEKIFEKYTSLEDLQTSVGRFFRGIVDSLNTAFAHHLYCIRTAGIALLEGLVVFLDQADRSPVELRKDSGARPIHKR